MELGNNYQIYFRKIPFYFSFCVLCFFSVFTKSGTDLQQYISIYNSSNLTIQWILGGGTSEYGFRLFFATLHYFIKNPYIGIGIVKGMSLLIVYISVHRMRFKIDVGASILFYVAVFYFPGFNVIRLTFAGSICLLASVFLYENKNFKAVLLAIIAITIHTSAVLYLIAVLILFAYRFVSVLGKIRNIFALLGLVLVSMFGTTLIHYLLHNTDLFATRYTNYMDNTSTSGFGQYVYYSIIIVLLLNAYRWIKDKRMIEETLVLTVAGFAVALLGYDVGMISRAAIYFMFPFMIFMPFYLMERLKQGRRKLHFRRFRYQELKNIIILYCVFRYMIMISDVLYKSSIYNYTFLWE
ncbi:MAG: EpsG family protein [Vallitaleaceae bacterium]|nr:EpsG family protein [Vallitaleaceae bacterium]